MKVVKPNIEILDIKSQEATLQKLERIGRVCYKSEGKITDNSSEQFIRNLIKRGHESVIEHESITVKVVCDRGVSHEIVRHRIASYSQESTRYCNYSDEKFGGEITVIEPNFLIPETDAYDSWRLSCETAESDYFDLLNDGLSPTGSQSGIAEQLKNGNCNNHEPP